MISIGDVLLSPILRSSRSDVLEHSEIATILGRIRPATMATELSPEVLATMQASAAAAGLEVGAFVQSFNMVSPAVVNYLQALSSTKIKSIALTTRKKLRRTLAEGVSAGEGTRKLAGRVRDEMKLSKIKGRASVIARTESHNAASFGRFESFKQSGLVAKKEWLATFDGRTRDTHATLNGTIQSMDEPFEIRGKTAMAPGMFGLPEEDINCRCVILPVLGNQDSLHLDTTQGSIDFFRLVRRQQREMFNAAVRGFKQWEKLVLRELEIQAKD